MEGRLSAKPHHFDTSEPLERRRQAAAKQLSRPLRRLCQSAETLGCTTSVPCLPRLQRSLMATLQEDEMFVLESGPHSPALSLDSMHSGAAVNTEQHPELPDPAAFWSQAANCQADRL